MKQRAIIDSGSESVMHVLCTCGDTIGDISIGTATDGLQQIQIFLESLHFYFKIHVNFVVIYNINISTFVLL